jgi:DNA-binding transcriptional MerR regulator
MGRYSIKETCNALGISRETLRKYTTMGLIRFGMRRNTGKKFYSGKDIVNFWRATF